MDGLGEALKRRFGRGQARFTEGFVASAAGDFFTDAMIASMTAVGGILILGISLRLLDLRQVRVANLLPALVLAPAAIAVVESVR